MSKKKKEKKIHNNIVVRSDVPNEWLYMLQEDITLRMIYDMLKECKEWNTEYWEEAKVLEIAVPKAGSVDVECMDVIDQKLFSYMQEKKAKNVYAVTVVPEYWEKERAVMQYLIAHIGGFFCGDTEDFKPELLEEG